MERPLFASILFAVVFTAPLAVAQEPSISAQSAVQDAAIAARSPWPLATNPLLAPRPLFSLGSLGEPTGDRGALPAYAASTPLRLSLASGIFPVAALFPQCGTREDASGNAVQGVPLQRYTLLALTPRLVLHGFSSAGCPIDGAIGGGITYAAPLRPSLWLVAGAGIYGTPPHAGFAGQTRSDVRLDLMKQTGNGRTFSVGIGRPGVTFGGTW
jgi:hypothetical protein